MKDGRRGLRKGSLAWRLDALRVGQSCWLEARDQAVQAEVSRTAALRRRRFETGRFRALDNRGGTRATRLTRVTRTR